MKWFLFIAFAGLVATAPLSADVDQQEIDLLREQVRMLTERLDQLERATAAQPQPSSSAGENAAADESRIQEIVDQHIDARFAASWTDRIRWKGDFRYRYENIDLEGRDERNRQRIRARAQLTADITEDLSVGLGLASGGLDPVSTNQTLGAGGSSKNINLDLAYFQWTGLENAKIVGGKFKNMLYRPGGNGLLWDGDWRPEGLAFDWKSGSFFATGFGTWIESDSGTANQEFSYGAQAGIDLALADDVDLVAGAGYYRFDTAGNRTFFGDDEFFGNTIDPNTGRYLYDYHEVEAFAEIGFSMLDRPASAFVDYVVNLDADRGDTGYAVGVKLGSAKAPGSWDASVIYEDLEADAVFGLLTDSDFGGGGTNAKGYILKGSYAIKKNWKAQFTYFINDVEINTSDPKDFDRLQLDLSFKYE